MSNQLDDLKFIATLFSKRGSLSFGEEQMMRLKFKSLATALKRYDEAMAVTFKIEELEESKKMHTNALAMLEEHEGIIKDLREEIANLKKDVRAREAKIRRLEKKLEAS